MEQPLIDLSFPLGLRRFMYRIQRLIIIIVFSALGGCYSPGPIEPPKTCHPSEPACAAEDYDEDGVPNGVDRFPLDSACSVEDTANCGACNRACELGDRCDEGGRCISSPPEVCDGADNDLDDNVDEGLIAPRASKWQGVCAGLSQRCEGASGWASPDYTGVNGYEEFEESCDGLDNDCDGLTDESLTAPDFEPQLGVCLGLSLQCDGEMGWRPPNLRSLEGYEGDESTCDLLDNDCDGQVDESLSGTQCTTPLFGRCQAGLKVCAEGIFDCVSSFSPTDETCDAVDEDCDGMVDEELTSPEIEEALGVCQHQPQTCNATGEWILEPLEALSTYEVPERTCDGLDNDCDGVTDESYPQDNCELTDAIGPCAQGRLTCVEGQPICDPLSISSEELCDGIDNDCDGGIDEALTSPLSENQWGVCVASVDRCLGSGGWAPPTLERLPFYESEEVTCDGLDNDCDDYIDEALIPIECDTGAVGRCQAGFLLCEEGRLTCRGETPTAEVCDGIDNDCDGALDESLVTPQASLYLGVCGVRSQICRGLAGWEDPEPVVVNYEIQEATCDGLDNDCDGLTDEALIGPLDLEQRGVCAGAHQRCVGALGWGPADHELTLPSYEPLERLCDGLDNDCDGVVDETISSTLCATSLQGQCAIGVERCIEGETECVPNTPPTTERCDFEDNDCDGLIDEDLTLGECAQGVGRCARTGEVLCIDGVYQCVGATGTPIDERCNAVDDDCDGVIDENANHVGLPCSEGVGACARQGEWTCPIGTLTCNVSAGPATAERCDSVDNDCDGRVDEGYQVGLSCVSGEGSCRIQSLWRCDDFGALICGEGPRPATTEICDGQDNDCDGESDEHIRQELCDGLDNDCDGLTDEGLGPEICDGLDNDCDTAVDESPCAPCGELCPTLTWNTIPAGDFMMGGDIPDQQPIHPVSIKLFQSTQEVSVDEYAACVQVGFCSPALTGGDCNANRLSPISEPLPINCVSWSQAHTFALWVGARLPSEAQWEYMARSAGREAPYPWGGSLISCERAHLKEISAGCSTFTSTHRCDERYIGGVSDQGLCDLMGNLNEWVIDDYVTGYDDAPNNGTPLCAPNGCAPQGVKVYRGGGWRTDIEQDLNNRTRFSAPHYLRPADIGFRVVRYGP